MPNRMDALVSKGMGAMKSAKARIEGLVGVFQLLSKQHGEASALVKRVKADPAKRAELWPKIRAELTSHEKAEMSDLYPVLRQFAETREIADHHDAEAAELSTLIEQINGLGFASDQWGVLFDQLADKLDHHVAEEENEIFPKAQQVIGDDRARAIEKTLLATKQRIMH